MKRDITLEFDLPQRPPFVWRALTEARLIEQWLMSNDFAPKVGHRFQMQDKPRPGWNGLIDSQVLEVEPEQRLSYTWERGQGEKVPTIVTFTLSPSVSGTRLRLEHKNFTGIPAVLLSFVLARGWRKMLGTRLADVLQHLEG